ncbi:fungal fruit body lectin [Suillus americanus]|nr:fungal fruit body lectin [Suillus americanus]
MSYTISVRTADTTSLNPGFTLVEKTVWHYANGGTWTNTESIQTLVMGGSGTSGTLRFRSGSGEEFLVALGVHNYKRWCDIVPDLAPGDTCMKIHPEYYMDGNPRNEMLWKQLAELRRKSKKGTNVEVKYVEELNDGKSFIVHITIS